jgi:hypothetical protein
MAGALRKVSQNYNWTIKRADNDLHSAISGTPRPQTSLPDLKPVALSVSPWDVSIQVSIDENEGKYLIIPAVESSSMEIQDRL